MAWLLRRRFGLPLSAFWTLCLCQLGYLSTHLQPLLSHPFSIPSPTRITPTSHCIHAIHAMFQMRSPIPRRSPLVTLHTKNTTFRQLFQPSLLTPRPHPVSHFLGLVVVMDFELPERTTIHAGSILLKPRFPSRLYPSKLPSTSLPNILVTHPSRMPQGPTKLK